MIGWTSAQEGLLTYWIFRLNIPAIVSAREYLPTNILSVFILALVNHAELGNGALTASVHFICSSQVKTFSKTNIK